MTGGRGGGPPKRVLDQALSLPALVRRLYPRSALGGLEPVAMQTLLALYESPGGTTEEIARRLAVEPATLRHAFAELARRGLIRDEPDPEDRRRRRRVLTSAGESVVDTFGRHFAAVISAEENHIARRGGRPEPDVDASA